ncbi:MAG: carbonate dehydratase [Myxococcales bacterium]
MAEALDPVVPIVLRPRERPTSSPRAPLAASGRVALDKVSLRIIGLTGEDDAVDLRERLRRLPGVEAAQVDFGPEHATVWVSDPRTTPAWVREAVRSAGFEAIPEAAPPAREGARRLRVELRRLAAVAATGVPAWLLDLASGVTVATGLPTDAYRRDLQLFLTAITVFWGARHLWWRMVSRAGLGRTELLSGLLEEGPAALAIALGFGAGLIGFGAGLSLGVLGTTAALAVLVQAGRAAEEAIRQRVLPGDEALTTGLPEMAVVQWDEREFLVRADHLVPGDLVVVGERDVCPVGGYIEQGAAVIDESLITGRESPSERVAGDQILAGAAVRTGRLVVRARQVGARTLLARVTRMSHAVPRTRGPSTEVAARLAIAVNVGAVVLAIAAAVVASTQGASPILPALAVLAAVGTRAVILSVPVAVGAASALAGRHGILLRDAATLDAAADVRIAALGRVGVLTTGRPTIPQLSVLVDDVSEERILAVAAAVERGVRHPVARAFVELAAERGASVAGLAISGTRRVPGHGVESTVDGASVAIGNEAHMAALGIALPPVDHPLGPLDIPLAPNFIAIGGRVVAVGYVLDPVREDAADGVYLLRKRRLRPVLLTGEDRPVVDALARVVGVADVHAGIPPEEQRRIVARLAEQGGVAAVVGAQSDVGLLGPASVGFLLVSDSRLPNADAGVTLLRGALDGVTATVSIARKLRHVVRVGHLLIGAWHVVVFGLATLGVISPVVAALSAIALSLAVTENALRASAATVEPPRPPRSMTRH